MQKCQTTHNNSVDKYDDESPDVGAHYGSIFKKNVKLDEYSDRHEAQPAFGIQKALPLRNIDLQPKYDSYLTSSNGK